MTQGQLELKIAETQDELEACFALLHDAYVASGFMRPHPSGLRVTPYHALPTTTTLCAKFDGQVVGTLSIVREGVFGFPMQSAFDISSVRAKEGRIAEISALAIHPRWRKTGGSILFPLMKFMYGYCTQYFDTRHLVIAVNPAHIEMYEAMLFFRRLTEQVVDRYDFVNGAPAVGATLDLHEAPTLFERAYGHKPGRRNLHRYFVHTELPEIQLPAAALAHQQRPGAEPGADGLLLQPAHARLRGHGRPPQAPAAFDLSRARVGGACCRRCRRRPSRASPCAATRATR